MTKNEFIELRIAELEARERYAQQLVMNRDMAHEAKMCRAQIQALNEILLADEMQKVLPKIGPPVQIWHRCEDSHLMHTDDHGVDTVLCENHLTDALVACRNCKQPWPIKEL